MDWAAGDKKLKMATLKCRAMKAVGQVNCGGTKKEMPSHFASQI
jgi:hypothetical protein